MLVRNPGSNKVKKMDILTRIFYGFHMSLHIMGEKLKLNEEKQIYGTTLKFEIHGIDFKVRHGY